MKNSARLARGMTPEEIACGKYQVGEGILGKVMQHGLPMVIPDVGQDPEFLDRTRSRGDLTQPVAFIAVPIKVGGETGGVLTVDRLFARDISCKEDVRVLRIVASLIGQAVSLQQHVCASAKVSSIRPGVCGSAPRIPARGSIGVSYCAVESGSKIEGVEGGNGRLRRASLGNRRRHDTRLDGELLERRRKSTPGLPSLGRTVGAGIRAPVAR